jgi:hypothetical protein
MKVILGFLLFLHSRQHLTRSHKPDFVEPSNRHAIDLADDIAVMDLPAPVGCPARHDLWRRRLSDEKVCMGTKPKKTFRSVSSPRR